MFFDILVPRFPVRASMWLHEDEQHDLAFARLHERERFVAFVHRPEAAWEKHECIGMADERELAGEKIFEGDELLVLAHDRIGRLLPGKANVRAEAHIDTGAFVPGLHYTGTRAGNDHVTSLRDFARELDA